MSIRRWRCFTNGGLLTFSTASRPLKPFASVAKGRLWIAPYCSNCDHTTEAMVTPNGAAFVCRTARMAVSTSCQVFGSVCGSTPAFSNTSRLYQAIAVDELNGIDASRPSCVL